MSWSGLVDLDAQSKIRRAYGFRLDGGEAIQQFIVPRILEANALYEAGIGEGRPPPLYEVHPEVSFHALAGAELPYAKHSWAGHALRRSLLSAAGIDLPDDLGEAGRAGPDDVLDAAAVAWTAHRIARGIAGSLPDPPQHGHIAIWY